MELILIKMIRFVLRFVFKFFRVFRNVRCLILQLHVEQICEVDDGFILRYGCTFLHDSVFDDVQVVNELFNGVVAHFELNVVD